MTSCRFVAFALAVFLLVGGGVGCTPAMREPRLTIESLNPIRDDRRAFLEGVLRRERREIGSVRALLKVRAQKSAFVQELSAAFVKSDPAQARISFFATQFNRLTALLVVNDDFFEFLLPDERIILEGPATVEAMEAALGVPVKADELAAWLVGTLPIPIDGRQIYWDEKNKSLISEQRLPGDRRLRAGFIYVPAERTVSLLAVEVLKEIQDEEGILRDEVVLYASFHREKTPGLPQALAIELPASAVDLRVEISKMTTSAERITADEAAKLFRIQAPPGVQRVPHDEWYDADAPSLLTGE